MEIVVWIFSILIFSWCYSTLFTSLFNLKLAPSIKISAIIYIVIILILYLISYFLINKYFDDILTCSIIAAILSLFTAKKYK